jgi:hypothetical protein
LDLRSDSDIAQEVRAAFEALNGALEEASRAGLKVDVECFYVPDCDRPDDPPAPIYSAKVSRPILA